MINLRKKILYRSTAFACSIAVYQIAMWMSLGGNEESLKIYFKMFR